MTVNTRVIQLFLRQEDDQAYVPIDNGLRLQILPNITFLPQCQKHHFAAFIQDSALLVVWDDNPTEILSRVKSIENQLMNLVWNPNSEEEAGSNSDSKTPKLGANVRVREMTGNPDELDAKMAQPRRRNVFVQSVLTAITLILVVAAIGNGVRRMMVEVKVDQNFLRLALLVVAPLQIWLALVGL